MDHALKIEAKYSQVENTSADTYYTYSLIFSIIVILAGIIWDISWHMSIGRDSLFSPPHIAIYTGGVVAGLCSIYKTLQTTFWGTQKQMQQSVSFWGLKAPYGAMYCIWGAGAMLTSAPFDDWWHNTYGLDVKILSPPHALLALGIFAINFGSLFSISANLNLKKPGGWNTAFIINSGIILALIYIFVIEYMGKNKTHLPMYYQIGSFVFPLVLMAGRKVMDYKWTATTIAVIYMGIFLINIWVFPLFPAEAKLSPVRNPINHFVPLPFPVLLIIPAFFIDLAYQTLTKKNILLQSIILGGVFLISFFVIQYFFGYFLLSPASRNWIFATHEYPYYMDPEGLFRYKFVQFSGTTFDYLKGILIALLIAILSTWLGLRWGRWMKRIQR